MNTDPLEKYLVAQETLTSLRDEIESRLVAMLGVRLRNPDDWSQVNQARYDTLLEIGCHIGAVMESTAEKDFEGHP